MYIYICIIFRDNFARKDRFRIREGIERRRTRWKRSIVREYFREWISTLAFPQTAEFERGEYEYRGPRGPPRCPLPSPPPSAPHSLPTNARNVKIIFPTACARVLFLPAHAYVISAVNDHRSIPCRGILGAPDGRKPLRVLAPEVWRRMTVWWTDRKREDCASPTWPSPRHN